MGARGDRYDYFRDRLREARRAAGLTQSEVARRLKKPQSFISKAETGERRLDFVELEQLADIYGVDLSFFSTRKRGARR